MDAGSLKERIEIYKTTLTKNEVGEEQNDWVLKTETRSKVTNNSGSRNEENNEIVYNYIKTFEVRSYVDISEFDRIKWDGKFYRILNIDINKEYQKQIIQTELIND